MTKYLLILLLIAPPCAGQTETEAFGRGGVPLVDGATGDTVGECGWTLPFIGQAVDTTEYKFDGSEDRLGCVVPVGTIQNLQARIDSLEAKLKRAHVVVHIDTVGAKEPHPRVGSPTWTLYTDAGWLLFTAKISFDPED